MRKGRRKVFSGLPLVLIGTVALAATPAPVSNRGGSPVRLTVEVAWGVHPATTSPSADVPLELEATEGRVVEAVAWPPEVRGRPAALPRGRRLGAAPSGKVRARIEAPLAASLVLRGGGKSARVPILAIVDGPQRVALGTREVVVERLAWDALTIDLKERGDGIAAPGETVPVAVGFNVLAPDLAEVSLRCAAELRPIRGGEPSWRHERQAVVATNVLESPAEVWEIPAPRVEGSYMLEVRASWEPVAGLEGTRLGRWVRRRRNPASTTAVRRVVLTVVGNGPNAREPKASHADVEVEAIDLTRLRGQRSVASGRSPPVTAGRAGWAIPEAALVEANRRDLLGWINRAGADAAALGPADASGLAWSALGLKVPHPGRPHRLSITVTGGHPSALGVGLVDTGTPPRVALDGCASGPPVLDGGPNVSFSWLVWPDAPDPILVLVNRDPAAPVRVGTVSLTELAEVPAGPPVLAPRSNPRGLGVALTRAEVLDRFGGGAGPGDALATARNLSQYLAFCGASAVVLPETLADRDRRRSLGGQAGEDPIGPDRLDLLLRVLARQGLSAWIEPALDGELPGLPPPDSAEAIGRGLVRVDRRGEADGPAYHPLHPEVREALRRRVAEAAAVRKAHDNVAGLLIRLGPEPTLLGGPDTGLDDATFARFVAETFGPETAPNVPGLGTEDANRFAARSRFLAGPARMPWLTWRSRGIAALYAGLAAAARGAAPGLSVAVTTPGLDDGPTGDEARRVDLAGLAPSHAWRAVGLDLETWPAGEASPLVFRGVGLSTDDLAHDLATSPELDAQVVSRPGRGVLIGIDAAFRPDAPGRGTPPRVNGDSGLRLTAIPLGDGVAGDEPLGHAAAALDPCWMLIAGEAVVGHEERVRHFARAFRALPAATQAVAPMENQPFGVALRTMPGAPSSYLAMANDTPYPIRLETILSAGRPATVDDLGRGLRLAPEAVAGGSRLVLDLAPFGIAAIRVGAPQVRVGSVTPYPSEAVLADMQAHYDELSAQLSRLNQAPGGGSGPPNPGFEPATSPLVELTVARDPTPPAGWQSAGGMAATVETDPTRPHSGRASLRLDAPMAPASVVSDPFPAKFPASLTVQAWFRSAQADAKVRVWVEGEAGSKPFVRWAEVVVPADWAARAVRVSDLPPGGLDQVRLRFELLGTGSLWVDDVSVSGPAMSEAERLNARRVLMAAMHAYREKRYADFARLAGSHWARPAGDPAEDPGDRTTLLRTGKATALPQNRLLR